MALGSIIMVVVVFFITICIPAYADTGDISAYAVKNRLVSGSQEIYNIFVAIVAPVSVAFVAATAFAAFFDGERGMDRVKRRMGIVLLALIMVYLAPLIVSQVSTWFTTSNALWN